MAPTLEGSKVIIVFAITGIIIAMVIVLIIKNCNTVTVKEGFDSTPARNHTSCPTGSKSYYDKRSNLMCCNGTINGHECEGRVVCTFSINTEKHPSCRVVIQGEQDAAADALRAQQKQITKDECLAKCNTPTT